MPPAPAAKLPLGIRLLPTGKYEATYHQAPGYRARTKTFATLEAAVAFRRASNVLPAGVRELPSGKYQGRYKGPDGKSHATTLDSPLKAAAWVDHEKTRVSLGPDAWTSPASRKKARQLAAVTVGEQMETYIAALVAGGLKQTSADRYRRNARTRVTEITQTITTARRITEIERARRLEAAAPATKLAATPVVELTRAQAHQWWDAIQATYPDTRAANYQAYQQLRACMTDAVRREIIQVNPVDIPAAGRRPKADQEKKVLPTATEITDIIGAASENYRLAVALCLRAGLRRGEALGLYRGDLSPTIHPETKQVTWQVTIAQQVKRLEPEDGKVQLIIGSLKTEASARTIPLPSDLNPLIEAHLDTCVRPARRQPTEWGEREVQLLTTTKNGTLVSPNSFGDHFATWRGIAGANPKLHLHSGRYDVNSRLAEQGVGPKAIGQYLGEVDLSVITEIYQQVRENQAGKLGELLND